MLQVGCLISLKLAYASSGMRHVDKEFFHLQLCLTARHAARDGVQSHHGERRPLRRWRPAGIRLCILLAYQGSQGFFTYGSHRTVCTSFAV